MLMSGYQAILQLCALTGFWGAFISHAIFSSSSPFQWQLPVMIQLLPGIVLLLGTFLIPDSPRYYASKGEYQDAEKSLAWLRRLSPADPKLLQVLHEIQEEADAAASKSSTGGFFDEIKKSHMRKRLALGIVIMVAQNMVGQNALNFYAPVIFLSAGFTSVSTSLFLTGIFGLVKLLSALAFMFIFVRMKSNRFWLKIGLCACAICMLILAYYVKSLPSPDQKSKPRSEFTGTAAIPVLMVHIFSFFFTVSLGPISRNVCSEIFPLGVNAQCCAITTCTQWVFQIVVAAITPRLLAAMGWGTYLFYASFCLITFIWVWVCVPETRDVRLGRPMDELFGVRLEDEEDGEDVVEILETTMPLLGERGRRGSLAAYT